MIYGLKGKVFKLTNENLILDVNNVFYEIFLIKKDDYCLNEEVFIFVYEIIRNEEKILYGFKVEEELQLFKNLLGVKSVGPRTAKNILSFYGVKEASKIIQTSDITRLKQVPGIGPKAAGQIIFDLANELNKYSSRSLDVLDKEGDVYLGLMSLGFTNKEINHALRNLEIGKLSSQEAISRIIKQISRDKKSHEH